MFDAMKKHLTVRNVLIGTAVIGTVGGLVYLALRDDETPVTAEALADAGASLVDAGTDLIAQAAKATAETVVDAA